MRSEGSIGTNGSSSSVLDCLYVNNSIKIIKFQKRYFPNLKLQINRQKTYEMTNRSDGSGCFGEACRLLLNLKGDEPEKFKM